MANKVLAAKEELIRLRKVLAGRAGGNAVRAMHANSEAERKAFKKLARKYSRAAKRLKY